MIDLFPALLFEDLPAKSARASRHDVCDITARAERVLSNRWVL